MNDDDDTLIYLGAGPLAAILLGMALVPVRGFTTASNFTFLFLALTILVGELGGRTAAFATAVVSALSLDFFLTEPYLQLSIDSKHDLIACLGLAGCGILAASLAAGVARALPASPLGAAARAARVRGRRARARGLERRARGGRIGPARGGRASDRRRSGVAFERDERGASRPRRAAAPRQARRGARPARPAQGLLRRRARRGQDLRDARGRAAPRARPASTS